MTPVISSAEALTPLLTRPTDTADLPDVGAWWPLWQDVVHQPAPGSPLQAALAGGFVADRLGWAFAAGYQAALRALVPSLPWSNLAALCVTEATGNRPRDVLTRIAPAPDGGWLLSGAKRWTTLGPQGTVLLVVGRLAGSGELGDVETDPDRPHLRVARVPVPAPGLRIEAMPPTPFVPEVPHARLVLDAVPVAADALLPGDGYSTVVKPFRTLEDLYVTTAALALLLREARARAWPADFVARIVATLTALAALASAPTDTPATHVALEGALQGAHTLCHEAGSLWAAAPEDPAAARWARDLPLLGIARSARAQRFARAWERLQAGG